MSREEYQGVWVFIEQRGNRIKRVGFELLGKGRELADALGVKLIAILLGDKVKDQAAELISYGADKVLLADEPILANYQTEVYTRIITKQVLERKPEILILGATSIGRDLAPRIARRLNTGLTADCTGLSIDQETRLLFQTRPTWGGNLMATIVCPHHRPQMATVRPRVMVPLERDTARKGEITKIPVEIREEDITIKLIKAIKEDQESSKLEKAKVVISVGRGIGRAENLRMYEELAELLGSMVGCSRPLFEAGWLPHSYQIGQTGKVVRPELNILCGISGATQHVEGMKESKVIVAINIDKDAEIFKIADYDLVGDLHDLVPMLIEELKKRGIKQA